MFDRKIILENGEEFYRYGFGAKDTRDRILELVFNTSMSDYQEIVSDPSYTDQAVVMTYPLIGNYSVNEDDYETERPSVGALIVHEVCEEPSNFRCSSLLGTVMERFDIAGVSGINTRKLTRMIRDVGTCRVMITEPGKSKAEAEETLRNAEMPKDAVNRVACKNIYTVAGSAENTSAPSKHIVLIDCGAKKNIERSLVAQGARVTVVPWNTDAARIKSLLPDGIMVSNGPGDPQDVRALRGYRPIFGIYLGHQILALSYGARTYKLKFGHRGGNYPVKDFETGKVAITSQNHSYAVDPDSLAGTQACLALKEEGCEVVLCNSNPATIMTDTAITVCNMENLDTVGIHTGDSIVVCPSQTITDREYQMLRSSALKIIRALKIEGGCNVQFALDPKSFQYYLIEVNPWVSRPSALASKASGYPIARVSAKIGIGLALDEIRLANTPASFEPALDYVVFKLPRFPFDKFADADNTLSTQMKVTGEVMSVGRCFEEGLLKVRHSEYEAGQEHCRTQD